jgi:symplekin
VKKAADAVRTSHESVAVSAAAHAAKVAAEKRATAALLMLRDAAFQRDEKDTRKTVVECAVGLASGRLPSIASVQDKALKLTMNIIYAKNDILAAYVVDSASEEMKYFAGLAVEGYDAIQVANETTENRENHRNNPLAHKSEEEKAMMDLLRKPTVLFMALCIRQPEMIETLFRLSSMDKATVLSMTVRANMPKLARPVAAQHGAADVAMRVASMCGIAETPLLLSFLENLAPGSDKSATEGDIVEACFKIQDAKSDSKTGKDPRYIIPVVAVMKRKALAERLPEFMHAEDNIFLAALFRMGDRLKKYALVFRDEVDEENPVLVGMTYCEQLVYLHQLDFASVGIAQKRYLSAIKLCLEDVDVFNDEVIMSALEYMSGLFFEGSVSLPLAFMRTVILTCTKHESLHARICNVLLPRLVEGKIYDDPRQWEGWMRCAHMLEKSGANKDAFLTKLPADQMMQYQTKWAGK